jgi:hypothetical protein
MATRSDIGRDCRDAFLSLVKTCDKLGIAVWDYPGSRFKVAGYAIIEPLDHYVRARQPRLIRAAPLFCSCSLLNRWRSGARGTLCPWFR